MPHNDIWLCQMYLRGTLLFLYCLWYEHELWLPAFQFSLVSSFLLSGSLMLQLELPVFKPVSANHVNLRVSSFRNDAWFQSLVCWNKLDLRNESCQVLYQSSALVKVLPYLQFLFRDAQLGHLKILMLFHLKDNWKLLQTKLLLNFVSLIQKYINNGNFIWRQRVLCV